VALPPAPTAACGMRAAAPTAGLAPPAASWTLLLRRAPTGFGFVPMGALVVGAAATVAGLGADSGKATASGSKNHLLK